MTESFLSLFKESIKKIKTSQGSIVRGLVIFIDKDIVLVDAGLKSESIIPIEQFYNSQNKIEIQVGDYIDVLLETIENGFGETLLSREKAKRYESWLKLEKAYEKGTIITGFVSGKVKGGFTVELDCVRAFLPGSLVDIRPIRDSVDLEGKILELKVVKLDQKRNNIVVSRRAVIESENFIERSKFLDNIKEGNNVKGVVKNLTDYGAFIDLGGLDGLLHITDISWKRIKSPNEIINIGDEITVKILKFDKEKNRVSLGLKQLEEDPWLSISKLYPEGTKVKGSVTNITDYGCFVEIKNGVEGLVHISEMDWTNKNIHPSKIVNVGDTVEVVMLNIDEENRRISLGLKQCRDNPWEKFSEKYKKGDRINGKIKSVTEFGIFIELEGNIDGLIHVSDISWNNLEDNILSKYKKGETISSIILQIDSDRERISLGIKQLTEDPINNFILHKNKDDIVNGSIIKVEGNKALIKLTNDGVVGYLNFPENYKDFKEEIELFAKSGNNLKLKINNIDKKNRIINLSLPFGEETFNFLKNKKDNNKVTNVMTEAFKAATKNE